jgi:hypothetical protein
MQGHTNCINFYKLLPKSDRHNPHYDDHLIELPFRMTISCGSGQGKTVYLLNLIKAMDKTFETITVYTKAEEPLYSYLEDSLERTKILYHGQDPIPPIDISSKSNKLIVFDDMVMSKEPMISEYYIRGRKAGYSIVYISQTYYGIPKTIRINAQYIALGPGIAGRDLRMILSEFPLALSPDELKELYHRYTAAKMHFILIDTMNQNIRHMISDIVWPTCI